MPLYNHIVHRLQKVCGASLQPTHAVMQYQSESHHAVLAERAETPLCAYSPLIYGASLFSAIYSDWCILLWHQVLFPSLDCLLKSALCKVYIKLPGQASTHPLALGKERPYKSRDRNPPTKARRERQTSGQSGHARASVLPADSSRIMEVRRECRSGLSHSFLRHCNYGWTGRRVKRSSLMDQGQSIAGGPLSRPLYSRAYRHAGGGGGHSRCDRASRVTVIGIKGGRTPQLVLERNRITYTYKTRALQLTAPIQTFWAPYSLAPKEQAYDSYRRGVDGGQPPFVSTFSTPAYRLPMIHPSRAFSSTYGRRARLRGASSRRLFFTPLPRRHHHHHHRHHAPREPEV